jgi:hypothetical protein
VASRSKADDAAYAAAGLRLCLSDAADVSCEHCGGCDGTSRGAKRRGFYLAMHGSLGSAARKRADAACPAADRMLSRMADLRAARGNVPSDGGYPEAALAIILDAMRAEAAR